MSHFLHLQCKQQHTCLTVLCPGLPGWAGTRKVKPIWISPKQETVSGSGIIWAICKSAPRSRQTMTPAPHRSVFTGWITFLPPNQSTEGISKMNKNTRENFALWSESSRERKFHRAKVPGMFSPGTFVPRSEKSIILPHLPGTTLAFGRISILIAE